MKNKRKRSLRVLALLLTLAMVLSLTACGGNSSSSSAPSSSESSSSNPSSSDAESSDGGDEGEQPAETGPCGLDPNNRVTLSCFFNFTWYPIDSWSGIIAEELTRLTGVDLDITVAVDSQQLGVMIASGDLPDMISTGDMLSNLSSSDLCYDWQSLIDEYQVDWQIDQQDQANALSFSQEEGKFFTVTSHFATEADWKELDSIGIGAPMAGSLLYRRDIYEAMGSPAMETLDDLRNVLLKVKEEYPDTTPLMFDPVVWKFVYFRQAFGLGNSDAKYIEQEDGNWITVVKDPRYKEYLKYVNGMYRDGLFSADNYGMEGTSFTAAVASGSVFAWTYDTQEILSQNALVTANVPEAVVYEAPVVGDPAGAFDASIGWMGTFISKNCKDPETAIRYMQFVHSDEGAKLTQWGREGYEYTLDASGAPQFSDEWNEATSAGTHNEIYNTYLYQGGSKVLEAVGRCASFPEEMVPNYSTLRQNFSNKAWTKYAEPAEGSDEKIILDQLFDGQSGVISTGEAKIILSATDEEFEANFQEMLNNCESVGMAELEAYMNEQIKEAMKIYGVA